MVIFQIQSYPFPCLSPCTLWRYGSNWDGQRIGDGRLAWIGHVWIKLKQFWCFWPQILRWAHFSCFTALNSICEMWWNVQKAFKHGVSSNNPWAVTLKTQFSHVPLSLMFSSIHLCSNFTDSNVLQISQFNGGGFDLAGCEEVYFHKILKAQQWKTLQAANSNWNHWKAMLFLTVRLESCGNHYVRSL